MLGILIQPSLVGILPRGKRTLNWPVKRLLLVQRVESCTGRLPGTALAPVLC
jgi:hypothetical protein